jgi:F-type H+-transporting ATPase subunit alpha
MFAGTNGYADNVPLTKVAQWQADLVKFMETSHPEVGRDITEKKAITDANRENLIKALDAFTSGWQA